jgi:glycosyltransferase involved in cell wall biosynthesis
MRISIALATYNGSAFVSELLDSLGRQTRLPDELVVCDDCSQDDTVEHVERFAAHVPFEVRVERNATNLTSTPNFEKALGLCTGDVVFFADQDDVWHPTKIEALSGALEASPDAGLAFCNGRVVDADLRPMGHDLWTALGFGRAERARVRSGDAAAVFARHVVAAGTTLAFRASHRDLYLPFPGLRDCHDSWVAFLIASVSGVRLVEEPLIDYRVHGGNQIGLHRLSLAEQLERARWQIASGIFRYGVDFFSAARRRLVERGGADSGALALIDEKIEHCRRRDEMPARLLARLPAIAGEALNRRYWRYSYGIRSVAQDLLLR